MGIASGAATMRANQPMTANGAQGPRRADAEGLDRRFAGERGRWAGLDVDSAADRALACCAGGRGGGVGVAPDCSVILA